jgi:hypothetical protein
MPEPTITCPSCHSEIKLTESPAAPLIESTRRKFDQKMALKDSRWKAVEDAVGEARRSDQGCRRGDRRDVR